MKYFYYILISSCLIFSCTQNKIEYMGYEYEDYLSFSYQKPLFGGLNGKVKSYRDSVFYVHSYFEDVVIDSLDYTLGNNEFYKNGKANEGVTTEYIYSKQQLEQITTYSSGKKNRFVTKYKGKYPISKNSYGNDGLLFQQEIWKHNDRNQLTEYISYNSDGQIELKISVEYFNGQTIYNIEDYFFKTADEYVYIALFDEDDRVTELDMYYDDELTTKAISEYYGTSEKVKSVITYFYESGSLDKKRICYLDKYGYYTDIIEYDDSDKAIEETKFVNTYDKKGNMIQSLIYESGKLTRMQKRSIEYY